VKLALLALRNLSRNRRRTLISLLVVATGTVALVLTAGFIAFSFRGLEGALIRGGLGHLEVAAVVAPGMAGRLDRPPSAALSDWRPLRARLAGLPGVDAVGANVHLMGMASTPGGASASFVGVGSEPDRERAMGFTTRLRAGSPLADAAPPEGEDTVLLARGLAESLGVQMGDAVTLLALAPDGMLNALDVRVAGILTTGVQDLDTRFLKMHLTTAQRLLQTEAVSDLLITLARGVSLEAGRRRVETAVAGTRPPLAVVDWRARAPFYGQVRNLYLGIFWFLGTVILVLVVLSASNTLLMAVLERTREIGTLRAIGTSRAQVAGIVLLEALWLGLLGAALGSLLGWLAMLAINAADLKMPPPPGAVDPIDLELAMVPEAFLGALGLMLLVLALAAAVPVARAVRLRVAEALASV
jgi:putative ABC transport system permease protein